MVGEASSRDTTLAALEFPQILHLLVTETATPAGAALALSLRPQITRSEVQAAVRLTGEAAAYLEERGSPPFGTVTDIAPLLERLKVERSLLTPMEILDLLGALRAGRDLRSTLGETRQERPLLANLAAEFPDFGNLIRFLDGKITSTGELEDHASEALTSLRQEINRCGRRLRDMLDDLLAARDVKRALQDDFISIRNDRHVVPLRAENRSALPGIVHGVSGSGATVFVEPLETVELNNEIVTLRERESEEVKRLLREYSDLLRGRLPELRSLWTALGRIDLAIARGRLGRRMQARPATISDDGSIELEGGRHPLVEASLGVGGGSIIPLDLRLPAGSGALIISGPNTGGKTVALKTLGLLSLMNQSGLLVPAANARLPLYAGIFIDIGDRQSIPEHLSTFSARMKNIASMTHSLTLPGLVLLDEIGTGTDPEEGAALAIAIIEHFRGRGAAVVATTHLESLKAYAASTPGWAISAMEFNESTLLPTYRLIPGIPGRSGGLDIAARLGLPESILRDARAGRDRVGGLLAAYLARLHELTGQLESQIREVEAERRSLAAQRAEMLSDLHHREEGQRLALRREIETALATMIERGESYLRSIQDAEVRAHLRRDERRAATRLHAEARHLTRVLGSPGAGAGAPPAVLRPGAVVIIGSLGLRGTIEQVRRDRVDVQVRGKRLTVSHDDCRPAGETPAPASRTPRLPDGVSLQRSAAAASDPPGEIRLLGLRVDEALERVDKFLDDASLAGLAAVRLVHGIGTGRLRKAIADLLANHLQVERFENASDDQGGSGVTVVTLRT